MRLTLPYPPSANRYWRSFRGRTVVSAEARNYKREVAKACKAAGLVEPLSGEVALSVTVYRPILRGDLGNRLKVLEDALNGFAWHDDEQVARIHMERHLDRAEPRVEVEVQSLEDTLNGEGLHQTHPKLAEDLEAEVWGRPRMKALLAELRAATGVAERCSDTESVRIEEAAHARKLEAHRDYLDASGVSSFGRKPEARMRRLATPNVRRKP